jgi:hypothetical protein
MATP